MKIVKGGELFNFNYVSLDFNNSLYVAFKIYDVTTGTAVFNSQVVGQSFGLGGYSGTFTPTGGHTYLIIGLVFTSNTYVTVNALYAPSVECYQAIGVAPAITYLAFAYGTYDQNAALSLAGQITDMTSGAPVFNSLVGMVLVANGVYFGHFLGVATHSYNIVSAVYTDNTYTVLNTNRAQAGDDFECIPVTGGSDTIILLTGPAVLEGADLSAELTGADMSAILEVRCA